MTTKTTSAAMGSTLRDGLKQDAARLKGSFGDRAKTEATTRIDQAAHAMGSASTALEAAAEKLESNPDAPEWMASAIQQAARKMESLAGELNGRDLDDISREVTQFARSNPGTFLAVSAAAGFAAARVLRAGADKQRFDQPSQASENQWSTGEAQMDTDQAEDIGSVHLDAALQPTIEGIAP